MPRTRKRIVFLGDSITDGHTYPLLIAQALGEVGKPVPVCINAGIASDTAKGMAARVERDILVHKPDIMTISVGINDCIRHVPLNSYIADVDSILKRVVNAGIQPIVMTTSVLGPKQGDRDEALKGYNEFLLTTANLMQRPVAPVYHLQDKARRSRIGVLEADDVHPNFAGHRIMAQAVLEAMGHRDVPVPEHLNPQLMPGVVTPWLLRAVDRAVEQELDEASVQKVVPDSTWTSWSLPETAPASHWWPDQERQRGFVIGMDQVVGKSADYLGVATLDSPSARQVYFNTGAQLQSIWLNGKRIYKHTTWNGWHAGRERLAVELPAGKNQIVIETKSQFFLSVTERNDW